MEANTKAYYPYLNSLKLLAAIMVTFYHLAYYKLDYGVITQTDRFFSYIPNMNRIIMSACCVSVPLFFMCSGAQLFRRDRSWKYCLSKAAKIFALILIWYVTGFPSWFFFTLIALYVTTPMLQYCMKKKKVFIIILVVVYIVFPFLYCYILPIVKLLRFDNPIIVIFGAEIDIRNLKITGLFTSYAVVYYLLGAYLSMHRMKHELCFGILLTGIGYIMAVMEVVLNVTLSGKMFDGVNDSFQCIDALIMSAGLFCVFKNVIISEKKDTYIRSISGYILPIYLLHSLIISLLYKIINISSMNLISAIGLTLVIDAICVCIGAIIKRIPYLNWIIKI